MNQQVITAAEANLELTMMNAESESWSSSDFYLWLDSTGLPPEVSIRIKDLIEKTKEIAGKVINIGKIILVKIIEFCKAHPNLAVGVAIGAAIGALAYLIPWVGGLLAAITVPLGAFLGGLAGQISDMREQGQVIDANNLMVVIPQAAISLAKDFFKLFADIISVLVS